MGSLVPVILYQTRKTDTRLFCQHYFSFLGHTASRSLPQRLIAFQIAKIALRSFLPQWEITLNAPPMDSQTSGWECIVPRPFRRRN